MKSYCIFCKSGAELKVAEKINSIYKEFTVIVPTKLVQEKRKDIWIKRNKALIPGYAFLYLKEESQKDIYPIDDIINDVREFVNDEHKSENLDNITNEVSQDALYDSSIVWDAPKHSKVRVTDMYKILRNDDGYKELLHEDLQYANWIYKHHGNFKESKVICDGDLIKIIDGPLLDFHGKIIKIDKHKRRAYVEIEFDGGKRVISLGIELVRPCQD